MSEKSSDQSEKPTSKRLQDARKDGKVSKSQDLSRTLLLLTWLGMLGLLGHYLLQEWLSTSQALWRDIPATNAQKIIEHLFASGKALITMLSPLIFLAVATALIVEFLQVGPLLTFKQLQPDLKRLNPAEGVKKMFSQKNLFELVKSVLKTLVLIMIIVIALRAGFADLLELPYSSVHIVFEVYWHTLHLILASVILIFLFVSILDVAYQKYAYTKELMMSKRDIRQEHKNSEGDPLLKSKRRQLHQEWSQENTLGSVRQSSVVVTNPTHFAVALYYETGKTDLPLVMAKGEDYTAKLIRQAAEEAGVPIMENVDLARALYRDIPVEHYITADFFEAVAQLLHWAESVRNQTEVRPS